MLLSILAIWGCVPEFAKGCVDLTNSSSAYLGVAGGVAIGAVISWWIYNRQNKIEGTHDDILQRIEKLRREKYKYPGTLGRICETSR